jgi:hypothetical protein
MSVTKFNSFFSDETYTKLIDYIKKIKTDKNSNLYTSTAFWDEYLINSSTPVVIYDFSDKDSEIFNLLKKEIELQIPFFVTGLKIHFWPKLSYITWHNDGLYKGALTVYLNEKWESDWGGYFMYEEDDEIKAIKPDKNTGVFLTGGTKHCVTTINLNADIRISLQCFLTKEKKVF